MADGAFGMSGERQDRPWRSAEERSGTLVPFDPNEDLRRELLDLPLEGVAPTRRSFLKLAGFGVAAAATACSRAPIEKAIPLLVRPEEIVPGRAYWIATTCAGCPAGCGVLAKCRDGRPIKLEGSKEHPINRGGLCAVGQAQVLSLYDSRRLDGARRGGARIGFGEADREILAKLADARAAGGRVRLLTSTIHAPSTRAWIARFLSGFADGRHVAYDALSCAAILDAHEATHGVRALPRLHLERAKVVASFDADFLGVWISPVEFTAERRATRDSEAPDLFQKHVQLEPRMSLTGGLADRRVRLAPHEVGPAIAELARLLAARAGVDLPPALSPAANAHGGATAGTGASGAPAGEAPASAAGVASSVLQPLADELWRERGRALVLCGVNDLRVQKLVNFLNELLGAYGALLNLSAPSQQRLGDDRALTALRRDLEDGKVDALIVAGCNPAYELPDPRAFAVTVRRVPLVVACSTHDDETAALAHYVLPVPHFLESWDDGEPAAGVLTFTQPAVPPLVDARTLRRTLAAWCGDARDDRELLRAAYSETIAQRGAATAPPFERALHDGFALVPSAPRSVRPLDLAALEPLPAPAPPPADRLALVLYAKVALPDGRHAHNPWLQELPDPVTKVAWDNYASLAPATAASLGLTTGDVVRVKPDGGAPPIELPVLVQPGQHESVVAIALGYGRSGTDRFTSIGPEWLQSKPTVEPGGLVGVNAAPLLAEVDGFLRFDARSVALERAGRRAALACTQDHHTLSVPEHLAPAGGEVREAVRAVSLAAFVADPAHALHREHVQDAELWPDDHAFDGPRWGMAIDLSRCTGCSGCVIGCQAENNVPVVGRDEVRRHREMQWLRIDRYWDGEPDSPRALHLPMMCQQCGHAPCETVCPVLATVHSREGLNQQVYNRCVGTRYCANNCPYKVRRFNWFDYPREDRLQNLSLNPDVTVRSRGVMEKCSFCVQRILEAKLRAREEGRPLADGEIEPACQQSCPAQAIIFGDLNDPDSRVSRLSRSERGYAVLEELNVKPAVRYLAAVRDAEGDGHGP
jgi:molybdopterin-containing oxidoreductase family iron-sulfur binding subunit